MKNAVATVKNRNARKNIVNALMLDCHAHRTVNAMDALIFSISIDFYFILCLIILQNIKKKYS